MTWKKQAKLSEIFLDLGGVLTDELRKGRFLRISHWAYEFAVGLIYDEDRVSDLLRYCWSFDDAQAPVLAVPLSPAELDEAQGKTVWGEQIEVDVFYKDGVWDGTVAVNAMNGVRYMTALGAHSRIPTLLDRISRNEYFLTGDVTDEGRAVVYRALSDYREDLNGILYQQVATDRELAGAPVLELRRGRDQVVYSAPTVADEIALS